MGNTKILRESEDGPTTIEVPDDHSCIVVAPDGAIDLLLIPAGEDDEEVNEGAMRVTTVLICMADPELRAIVEKKISAGEKS